MTENKIESKEQESSDIELLENTQNSEENDENIEEIKIPETETKELENVQLTEPNNSKSNKGIIIALVIVAMIIVLLAVSTIFSIAYIGSTKIIKGISIANVDVSGLTKEQAEEKLNQIYSAKSEKKIYLTYGEYETEVTYETLEVEYQIKNAIEEAYKIGRGENIFANNMEIASTWIKGKTVELQVTIDEGMIEQMSQNINNSIDGAVQQSSYYIEDGKLIITSGKNGVVVEQEKLIENIYNVLKNQTEQAKIEIPVNEATPDPIDIDKIHSETYKQVKNAYYTKEPFKVYPEEEGIDFDVETAKAMLKEEKQEYEIPLIITKPTVTVNSIGTEAFPDLLATFSTKYQVSNKNRTTNLKLATQKINGVVLLPGQEFSYNKTLGERTIAAGYKEAAVYSNGQVVNGLGGGICQISSTLYDAVVMADLKITSRRNHQFVTSYVPAGKDATVVYGSQDFKFVNSRDYPIKIEATVNGGVATVSIWGVKKDVEYDITIETKKIATIAYTTQYIQDSSLPVGKEIVKQKGSNGVKVEAYKVVKQNGKIISTTLLSKDTYNAMKRIVRVGTKR